MIYRIAADLVLVAHFTFIVLVVAGGLVAYRYAWFAWIHIPAASWGAFIELTGRICPLTTLENFLRIRAGQEGYANSFVEHYILPVIYPAGLTRHVQLVLAGLVVAINVIIYATILLRKRKARRPVTRT
jgi:predicted tellurium resistance membrane protein TerC